MGCTAAGAFAVALVGRAAVAAAVLGASEPSLRDFASVDAARVALSSPDPDATRAAEYLAELGTEEGDTTLARWAEGGGIIKASPALVAAITRALAQRPHGKAARRTLLSVIAAPATREGTSKDPSARPGSAVGSDARPPPSDAATLRSHSRDVAAFALAASESPEAQAALVSLVKAGGAAGGPAGRALALYAPPPGAWGPPPWSAPVVRVMQDAFDLRALSGLLETSVRGSDDAKAAAVAALCAMGDGRVTLALRARGERCPAVPDVGRSSTKQSAMDPQSSVWRSKLSRALRVATEAACAAPDERALCLWARYRRAATTESGTDADGLEELFRSERGVGRRALLAGLALHGRAPPRIFLSSYSEATTPATRSASIRGLALAPWAVRAQGAVAHTLRLAATCDPDAVVRQTARLAQDVRATLPRPPLCRERVFLLNIEPDAPIRHVERVAVGFDTTGALFPLWVVDERRAYAPCAPDGAAQLVLANGAVSDQPPPP